MELIFVRHGQGEHNLDIPGRLERKHPRLTSKGREQVIRLAACLDLTQQDVVITGPSVRTVETSELLTQHLKAAELWVSPLAGPRMFPQNPSWSTLPCDIPLTKRDIEAAYPHLLVRDEDDERSWQEGINRMPENEFIRYGTELVDWIRKQGARRAVFVSHDGTVTAYRQLLGEQELSRADFLGEAGTSMIRI